MDILPIEPFRLAGIKLPHKTTNENGQSNLDCGNLWQRFEKGEYHKKIDKSGEEIYAVYFDYEGDYTKPFSYFIGYKVKNNTLIPDGLDILEITGGNYMKYIAKGKMPDCIANTWKDIWSSANKRAYKADFEVYGEKSKDWSKVEVEVFVSIIS